MKNEMPMAKKFVASKTTTKTEKRSRNTPVRLVIFVLAGLDWLDKDNHTIFGGAELVPLLADNLSSYIRPRQAEARSRALIIG